MIEDGGGDGLAVKCPFGNLFLIHQCGPCTDVAQALVDDEDMSHFEKLRASPTALHGYTQSTMFAPRAVILMEHMPVDVACVLISGQTHLLLNAMQITRKRGW